MKNGPEALEVIAQDWKDDLARLEECRRALLHEYIPQIASLNARLTEALFRIKELEEEVESLRSKVNDKD